MNYRNNGNSYYDSNQNKLGYSNVSKAFGYSNRNYYQNQNLNEDHGVGQVQFMLENQRKKFREAKDKLENQLDNQRKLRIEHQNKLIKLKDEFSRKDIAISELQFKINNLLHQNQDISVENDRLKHELARLEELYGGKIHELETQLSMEAKNFEDTTMQYNSQFEKFKKQGQDYVQQLTFEFQRKIKNLEEKYKSSQMNRRDLQMENKKLNDILVSNKLTFEEEMRDVKNRARDEEMKKIQQINRHCQQKIKIIEEQKEGILRKNNELIRKIQQKEAIIDELETQKNEQIVKLRQDNSDLSQQANHLNFLITKMKNEINEKDNLIGRSLNDNDGELKTLRQQLQSKKNQNNQLSASLRQQRMSFKEAEGEWQRRRRQIMERCSMFETQARNYKEEYNKICGMLKSKITSTIDNVAFKR